MAKWGEETEIQLGVAEVGKCDRVANKVALSPV